MHQQKNTLQSALLPITMKDGIYNEFCTVFWENIKTKILQRGHISRSQKSEIMLCIPKITSPKSVLLPLHNIT
jgi:hypothetical protein